MEGVSVTAVAAVSVTALAAVSVTAVAAVSVTAVAVVSVTACRCERDCDGRVQSARRLGCEMLLFLDF